MIDSFFDQVSGCGETIEARISSSGLIAMIIALAGVVVISLDWHQTR